MGKITAISILSILIALLACSCASSARYVASISDEEHSADEPSEEIVPQVVDEQPEIWPDLDIFKTDSQKPAVDTSAANRAMRLRWKEVVEILEKKPSISTAEAFLLARAFQQTGRYSKAVELFDQIAEDTSFVLYPYALIGSIEALSALGKADSAIARTANLPKDFAERGQTLKYEIQLTNKRYSDALMTLDKINADYPSHFGNMEYRLARANLLLEKGDADAAIEGYKHILRNNTGSYALSAAKALDKLRKLEGRDLYYAGNTAVERKSWGSAVDYLGRYIETGETYKRGEARYLYARAHSKLGGYSKAIDLYKAIIDDKAYDKAWAELGMAWCYRKLKKYDSARIYVQKAISDGAGTNAEAEALWETVDLYIELGSYDSAGHYGEKLSKKYPTHSLGDNGAMWAGIGAFAVRDYASAKTRFAYIPQKFTDRKFVETGEYWAGISSIESGDSSGSALLDKIAKSPILHYYRYLSMAELGRYKLPEPGLSRSSKWISYKEGIKQARIVMFEMGHKESVLSLSSVDARRAELFASMGLLYESQYHFKAWMDEIQMTPSVRIALLELATDWKLSGVAYDLSIKLLSDMGGYAKAPKEIIRLAYPTIFEEYVRTAAEMENVDPAFVFAIIRRESAFDPHVVSYAGAIGLCQFMPATGKTTAEQLGEGYFFETELLYDFETSVRYAARHIAELVEQFKKPEYILAAYNAGPNHAERWRGIPHSKRIELYTESVDFAQTRHYIKNVLGDYWAYKELWDESIPPPSK